MNSDLKHLIRLQAIDLAIQQTQGAIEKFPAISKALDVKLSEAQTALAVAQEKSKSNLSTRKKLEGEVSAVEARISKYREQMLGVKSNTEYRALQLEIEHAQKEIRSVEDKILTLMLEAETSQADLRTAEARLKEDQQRVAQERKDLEASHQKEVSALESYSTERAELAALLSDDLLPRYERVRKFRGGIGISEARDSVCVVCKVRIRPQVFQEIRKNDQIIPCDACQRILYDPQNMDHPFEVA